MPIISLSMDLIVDVPTNYTKEQVDRPVDPTSTLQELLVHLPPLGNTENVVVEISAAFTIDDKQP